MGNVQPIGDTEMGALVLSYENSCLHEADIKLLEPGGWINDNIVGFVFEYFENKQFKAISEDICFLSPQVAQFLKLCQGRSDEEVCDFLKPLDLASKKYIIIPVNDSSSYERIGGSHWSIMVYSKSDGKIFYLDSFRGYNRHHAVELHKRIGIHLKAFGTASFVSVSSCPQQPNVCDCGLYALCFAEEVCKGLLQGRSDFYNVNFTPQHAAETRERIRKNIYTLANK